MTAPLLEGEGLHTGAFARVRFVLRPGPVAIRVGDVEAPVHDLLFDGERRSTTGRLADGRLRVSTLEHLFAALAALGIREGLVVGLEGEEVPLVDGGARAFVDVLARLGLASSPPACVVLREGAVDVGASRYELTPSEKVRVDVLVDFSDERLAREACWEGDARDFRERIAPARTFGFERELDELAARGLARRTPRESVVLIGRDAIHAAGAPFEPDEPARHKLLDLIGDLYAHGGPPLGSVRAIRPGHAATHEAMRRALREGLIGLR